VPLIAAEAAAEGTEVEAEAEAIASEELPAGAARTETVSWLVGHSTRWGRRVLEVTERM
jgi:hypothetical protein